jgi:hypothetical protein
MFKAVALFFFVALCFLGGPTTPSQAADYLKAVTSNAAIGLGLEYSTGKYGTDDRSDFIAVPFYLDLYPTDRLDLELIIPYVQLKTRTSGSSTIIVTAQGARKGKAVRAQATTNSSTTVATEDSHTESGLGDISLTTGYALLLDDLRQPLLRATFYLKFPTADEDKGLGTGEFDFGPGLSLSKWAGNWHLLVEGSYVFQGDADYFDAKDYVQYTGGVGYQFSDTFYGALQALGASAVAEGADDSLEGRLKFFWQMVPTTGIEGFVSTGFTDGSPDFYSGLAVFYNF